MDKYQQELVKKYNNSKSFNKQMMQADKNYNIFLQQGVYCDMSLYKQDILDKFPIQSLDNLNRNSNSQRYSNKRNLNNQSISKNCQYIQNDIYFYYGTMQPQNSKTQKLAINFIKKLPKPNIGYILIYIHNFQDPNASADLIEFKKMLLMLPIQYFRKLRKFIIMKQTLFFQKDLFYWGTLSKFLKQKIFYIQSLQKIAKQLKIQYQELVCFLPELVAFQLQIPNYKKIVEKNKTCIFNQRRSVKEIATTVSKLNQRERFDALLQKENITEQNKSSMKIDKNKTKQLQPKNILCKQIQQYEVNQVGIPLLLHILIAYFNTQPQGLNRQGIFRKSVSIDQQNNILTHIGKKDYDYLQKVQNPHLIANLIKRFFFGLKTPIISYYQFNSLMQDQTLQNIKKTISPNFGSNLKRVNYITLMHLFKFLKEEVIAHETSNKMNLQSVAICFAPCLLKAQTPSVQDLIYAGKSATVVKCIIQNFELIFGDSKKQKQTYRQSYLMEKKKSIEASRISLSKQLAQNVRNSLIAKEDLSTSSKQTVQIELQKTQAYEYTSIQQKNQEHSSEIFFSQDQSEEEQFFEKSNKTNENKKQEFDDNEQIPKGFNKSISLSVQHLSSSYKKEQMPFSKLKNKLNSSQKLVNMSIQPSFSNKITIKQIDKTKNENFAVKQNKSNTKQIIKYQINEIQNSKQNNKLQQSDQISVIRIEKIDSSEFISQKQRDQKKTNQYKSQIYQDLIQDNLFHKSYK